MYEKYIKEWQMFSKQYGQNTALFLMVGKFYELYDIVDKQTGEGKTNMKQAVEILGIALSNKKDMKTGEDTLFAGFPEQSLQKFANLLTREGWTVVVCDQEKDGNKVTGRPVARIFSPGTHIEVAGAEAPYLAGVWIEEGDLATNAPPKYAAVVLDLTTGHIVSFTSAAQGQTDIWSADNLVHFFQVHPPTEIVVWWRGAPFTKPNEATFRRRFGLSKATMHLKVANEDQEGAMEHAAVRKSFLEGIFSAKLSLLPIMEQLNLQSNTLTERALVAILRFAEEHIPSAVQNLHEHLTWSPDDAVYLGNNTLTQLNYISSTAEQSVLGLFQKAYTSLGRREIRNRLLYPHSRADVIQERLDEVEYAYNLPNDSTKRCESSLRSVHDIARLHRRIVMYSVTAQDILLLDQSYSSIQDIANFLQGSILEMSKEATLRVKEYIVLFKEWFDIEKAKEALNEADISFLPDDKAPDVAQIEQKLKNTKAKATEYMNTFREWSGVGPNDLKLEVTDTSLTFSVTKTTLNLIKKVMDSRPAKEHPFQDVKLHANKSGRSTIAFPALDQVNFAILNYRSQLREAVQKALPEICTSVQHQGWYDLEKWISHVDVTITLARVAKERGYRKPILNASSDESAGFQARGLRHPLLESIQTRVEYVKHDISLGLNEEDDQGWLLYGMNASGKSSLMKAIGIAVLLAQSGSFVPAASFEFRPFKSILTRILNQDNLWAGLSSFAVEVSELRDIFSRADSKSLVLGDELCSGTESISATSLVAAGIRFLHNKESRFVFATHLHGLHSIPDIHSLTKLGTWHLRVHHDPVTDTLIYDRTLHKGPGGTLYGLEVAKAMHLSHDILEQAHKYRLQLLGETSHEEQKPSRWNAQIFRKECEVCKSKIVRELEVHHIKPRAEADEHGRFEDGTSMNRASNLIVVCQSCHDKYHSGEIEIGEKKQTSRGAIHQIKILPSSETPSPTKQETKQEPKSKLTNEQKEEIEAYLRKYPTMSLKLVLHYLKNDKNICITEKALSKIRSSLT